VATVLQKQIKKAVLEQHEARGIYWEIKDYNPELARVIHDQDTLNIRLAKEHYGINLDDTKWKIGGSHGKSNLN